MAAFSPPLPSSLREGGDAQNDAEPSVTVPGATLAYAKVVRQTGVTADRVEGAPVAASYEVEVDGKKLTAFRAVSCLVEPLVGDTVLVSSSPRVAASHVLSVLERAQPSPTTLSADGDLAIHLPSGKLDVVTKAGAAVTTGGSIDLTSNRLVAQAVDAELRTENLEASGRTARIFYETMQASVERAELIADRITTRARQAMRILTELDQLRAQCVDYVAKKSLRMHAENTVVTAESIAKVDAKNIHLG